MTSAAKQKTVQTLIKALEDDLSKSTLSDARRQSVLEQLKIHGRDPTGADAIYSPSGITTLTQYAFGEYTSLVVLEALRVVANALLLRPNLQPVLLGLNGVSSVAKLYHNQTDDFEFLGGRILFLCTYARGADVSGVFEAGLLNSIEAHLIRHADPPSQVPVTPNPLSAMAVTETFKLIFNLYSRCPDECKPLNASVPHLCKILQTATIPQTPLDPPIGPLLNALACLDFGDVPASSAASAPANEHAGLVPKLIETLTWSIQLYDPIQLDTSALSLLTVLRMLYDTSSAGVQDQMRRALLPADSERDLPLGQSSSLASHLLRLTTTPGLMHLPEAISGLMFEMSHKDATAFVRNIGYGYAAGYLMTHKIPIPETTTADDDDDASTGGNPAHRVPINPVTGQRLDREPVPDVPEMTPAEQEREAERLFVLFDRLRATGVVDVENPVRRAMAEGRLEELDDSDDDKD